MVLVVVGESRDCSDAKDESLIESRDAISIVTDSVQGIVFVLL